MKLLLDTHTFIWWDSAPAKLSPQALTLCVNVVFDHLSWPSVNAARGGSLLLAPPFSTGTGTMRAGGARSQLPAGEHARHHAPDPLRHADNAVFELWVMHSPAGAGGGSWRSNASRRLALPGWRQDFYTI
ncbi:MAG: hypothetical protein KatS3mg056_0233 [Chloroflexus sp.]|jgi:hypothetical protein|nr:MAG: hypothetical protein KatS3mg056_0233 [Chloroflexus sp.]